VALHAIVTRMVSSRLPAGQTAAVWQSVYAHESSVAYVPILAPGLAAGSPQIYLLCISKIALCTQLYRTQSIRALGPPVRTSWAKPSSRCFAMSVCCCNAVLKGYTPVWHACCLQLAGWHLTSRTMAHGADDACKGAAAHIICVRRPGAAVCLLPAAGCRGAAAHVICVRHLGAAVCLLPAAAQSEIT
jgi:hypothetical protein